MDAKTRTTRRQAAAGDPDAARRLLVEQLRAGTLRPGLRVEPQGGRVIRLAEKVTCKRCNGHGLYTIQVDSNSMVKRCGDCMYTGSHEPAPRAALRLCAYVGDEAAREMVPVSECSIRAGRWDSWDDHDRHIPLDTWLRRLSVQAEHMPPVVGEGPCPSCCQGCGSHLLFSARQRGNGLCGPCTRGESAPPVRLGCAYCEGTGRVSWSYPYTRWLLAAVAARVAEGVLPVWEAREGFEWTGPDRAPRRAVEAARAWVLCPCPEHEEACGRLVLDAIPEGGFWWAHVLAHIAYGQAEVVMRVGGPTFYAASSMEYAARLTTEDQVRAWVREAAREAVLGG